MKRDNIEIHQANVRRNNGKNLKNNNVYTYPYVFVSQENTKKQISYEDKQKLLSLFNQIELKQLQKILNARFGGMKYVFEYYRGLNYLRIPYKSEISVYDFLYMVPNEISRFGIEKVLLRLELDRYNRTLRPEEEVEIYYSSDISSKNKENNMDSIINDEIARLNSVIEKSKIKKEKNKAKITKDQKNNLYNEGSMNPIKIDKYVSVTNRNISLVKKLKKLYANRCQICGEKVQVGIHEYMSEVHHIRPLGKHKGSDTVDNMIVVCPNHHAMFDRGAITFDSRTMRISHVDPNNRLNMRKISLQHTVNQENINYHNSNIFKRGD
ncbi:MULTISPECIES: HNH endonuclease [Bacillus]|uniref:HNH endonuclease n=1 Tax=Bacillus TaxID=1386 RepID=UPI0002FFF176|nr:MULTISPECIES: HNH endonuclease [Bacillus]